MFHYWYGHHNSIKLLHTSIFQEKGRWINWWGRNRPGMGAAFKFLTRSPDNSNIPSSQEDIDRDVPNKQPYWLRLGSGSSSGSGDTKSDQDGSDKADRLFSVPVGSAGARATWLGHATVLAEVDSAVVITDPIFSQRASVSQWFGPKRYTQPGKFSFQREHRVL